MVTSSAIAQQQEQAAQAARRAVLPAAQKFTEVAAPEGLKDAFAGYDAGGALVGRTGTIIGKGYGGEIEITVGIDNAGVVTGVSIGGSNFSETAGLGARAKEAWFGAQYIGESAPISLKKDGGDIDAITSATITSRAVTKSVNAAVLALGGLTPPTEG
ncbi:MAG: FMN-binding protein [Clostridiales bacterium]|nr:FMN-binding protein [Clostridiales bacterium]